MLSGEESTWRQLKEALPTLEGLKEKSGILYRKDPQQPVCAERPPLTGQVFKRVRTDLHRHFLPPSEEN